MSSPRPPHTYSGRLALDTQRTQPYIGRGRRALPPPPLTARPGNSREPGWDGLQRPQQEAGCEDMCSFEIDPDDECEEPECEIYQPKQDFFRATAVGLGLLVRTPSLPAHTATTSPAAFSSIPYFPPSPLCGRPATLSPALAAFFQGGAVRGGSGLGGGARGADHGTCVCLC